MGQTGRFPFKDYGQENQAVAAPGNGAAFDMHAATEAVCILNVSAVGGTLDGAIQQSLDGGATWADIAGCVFATVNSAPNRQVFHYAPLDASLGQLRVRWAPSTTATLSVDFLALGEADTSLGDQI